MAGEAMASAGAKIYIGPTTAATTASAYSALSYTEIMGIETLGEFGDSAAMITFTGLADSRVQKLKGPYDAGDIAAVFARLPLDPGQIAAKVAAAAKFSYAIKVVLEDSADANDTDSVFYFHAKVMGTKNGVGGATDVLKLNLTFAITTAIIEVASVAVS